MAKCLATAVLLGLIQSGAAVAGATASARLIGLDGAETGVANFRTAAHGVLIEIQVKGLTPGPHAVLIHASSSCDPKTGFASAGPVFSFDDSRMHGYFAASGPRTGDLPVQFAGSDGVLHVTLFTTAFSLGDGAHSVFGSKGASLVVHEASDDYISQPEGRAGARLVCGPILRSIGPGQRKHRS